MAMLKKIEMVDQDWITSVKGKLATELVSAAGNKETHKYFSDALKKRYMLP